MSAETMRDALLAQERQWQAAADALRIPGELDGTEEAESHSASEVYGEAAAFLRKVLAENPEPRLARDPAALSPQTIWLAWHTVDDMVGFETEERRDEYAAAVPGVEAGTLELLNDSAARQFIIDAAAAAAEDEGDCECCGEVVPGAWPGFNDRNEVQACDLCDRFFGDDEAARAIADAVGGEVVERHDPELSEGAYWLVIVKDGEELAADRIRELAAAQAVRT